MLSLLPNEQLNKIAVFYGALEDFIFVVGHDYNSRRGERNYLAELLGTVIIDMNQRKEEIDGWMKRLEEK